MLYGFFEKSPFGAEAGVCEHGIEATESLETCSHEGLLVVPFGDIASQSYRFVLTTEICCQLRQPVLSPGSEYDTPALINSAPCRFRADARRGASDQ